jgi:hypothetical protein
MDDTVGFNTLNRFRTDPLWSSDCRLVMLYRRVKIQPSLGACVSQFFVLACSIRTNGPMDKRRPQADSAHQIGLKLTLHAFLIVVAIGDTGG